MNEGMRFCTIEHLDYHYHTTFSGWEMFENAWRSLSVFWIKIGRKSLAATKCFLDQKW
jgi:hypothetical protein